MPQSIGVPIKLLHESEGHKVTIELTNGEVYRGQMVDAEDNMNCQLSDVTLTGRDGKQSKLAHVYIRGSKVRFMILPDMLKNAPMFKRFDPKNKAKPGTGLGIGRGFGQDQPPAARGGRGGSTTPAGRSGSNSSSSSKGSSGSSSSASKSQTKK